MRNSSIASRPSRAVVGRARRHPRPAPRPDRVRLAAGRGRRQDHRAVRSDGNVSLEPAGQFELSGAPLRISTKAAPKAAAICEQVKAVGDRLGLGFLGLGMWPDKRRDELPIMPKGRYEIMLATCRASAISGST
jgi:hypothetical protein